MNAIEISAGRYNHTSNKADLSLLYSLKNNKFIKGRYAGNRVHGSIQYKVFAGVYLMLDYWYWSKGDPPRHLNIKLVKINENGECQTLKSVTINSEEREKIAEFIDNPIITDFLEYIPHYHCYPTTDFNKVYNADDTQRLVKFVEEHNGEDIDLEAEFE